MILVIFFLLYVKSFSLIIYAKYQFFYVYHYIDCIISSEGIIKPINPSPTCSLEREGGKDYIFYFKTIQHNLEKSLCLQFVNFHINGGFAFKYASINEYNITEINYEDYYYCNNCNMNTPKKFKVEKKNFYLQIWLSKNSINLDKYYNNLCLYPTSDISIFYIDENKINKAFYIGKTLNYIVNNELEYIEINRTFAINENEDYIFDLNTVSFKIVNITNKKGRIFNGEEELFEGSFFNAESNYLIYKRLDNESDEGYLMIITLVTKPRNQKSVNISTCERESTIYLYVAQKNCTMNEISNNFCQKCVSNYSKYGNKCYNKSEKISNAYYEETNGVWNQCEANKNNFTCSICPKGTYRDPLSQLCVKCQIKKYSNREDKKECDLCPIGYYSDEIGVSTCKKCPDGFTSLIGSDKCYRDCEPGYYPYGDVCLPCQPGYYSIGSSTKCLECQPGTYTNKEGMEECLKCEPGTFNNEYKQTTCINCPIGYFASSSKSTGCSKCPLGSFNPLIGNDHCENCDVGYYNDELGSKECKICQPNYYSDYKGASFCKECEENKYSLFGFNKCLPCNEIISHCNYCSKEGICLECNNKAINGYNNCTICENDVDWIFSGEYCKQITICPKYFYKDKKNNNRIYCIEDVNECPEELDYLNLDTKECTGKENASNFPNNRFKVKEETLISISNNIFEEMSLIEYYELKEKIEKGITLEGINSSLKIGTEDYFMIDNSDLGIGINLTNCTEKLRFKYGIEEKNKIIYKVFDITFNGNRIIDFSVHNTDNPKEPYNLDICQGEKIKIINPPLNVDSFKYEDSYKYNLNKLNTIILHGTKVYGAYSSTYNDTCYSLSELKKYDLTLINIRKYLEKYNIPICNEECEYEGENLKNFQVICYCPIKIDKNESSSGKLFAKDNVNYFRGNNLKVFQCFKLTFSFDGQRNNILSEIFILLFIINIRLIISTEMNLKKNFDDLITYCKEFIDKKNTNNKFLDLRKKILEDKMSFENKKKMERFFNISLLYTSIILHIILQIYIYF